MIFSVKEYETLQSEPMPYVTKGGFEVSIIEGDCSKCQNQLSYVKIMVNEYKNFCIIRPVGLCRKCNLVVSCTPIKITSLNDVYYLNNRWRLVRFSIFYRLRKWFLKCFGKKYLE